jgi:hypothetical protein
MTISFTTNEVTAKMFSRNFHTFKIFLLPSIWQVPDSHFYISFKEICYYYSAAERPLISIPVDLVKVHIASHFVFTNYGELYQVFRTYPVSKAGHTSKYILLHCIHNICIHYIYVHIYTTYNVYCVCSPYLHYNELETFYLKI